jgi:hypothetical protein
MFVGISEGATESIGRMDKVELLKFMIQTQHPHKFITSISFEIPGKGPYIVV